MRAEPHQTLRRDDSTRPDKRPFLGPNMLGVELVAEIVPEENGPDDHERPDVCTQGQRQGVM